MLTPYEIYLQYIMLLLKPINVVSDMIESHIFTIHNASIKTLCIFNELSSKYNLQYIMLLLKLFSLFLK